MNLTAVYLTYPLLDETFKFYAMNKRFPAFYDLLKAHGDLVFANELFLFSICESPGLRDAAVEFYINYLLPTKQALDVAEKGMWLAPITEKDPQHYRNILQVGGRVFERWAHVYYPKRFYDLCRQLQADPFTYTRDYYFRIHEFVAFQKLFTPEDMAYVFDARLMFTLNFRFFALAPFSYQNKVFRGIKQFYKLGKLEEGEERPEITILSPTQYLQDHADEYTEFKERLYDPTLYRNYDLFYSGNYSSKHTFCLSESGSTQLRDYPLPKKNKPFPVSIKRKEEMAYYYPVKHFINQTQYEKFKIKNQDRYAIQQENNGLPIVFVITLDIYLNFMEYWAIDKNGVPPIIHLLCKNNYLRFAVFAELLQTPLPEEGHLNFAEYLHPIYLWPTANSKAPPEKKGLSKREYSYLSLRWGVNEAIRRYDSFCVQTAKLKKWHFGGVIASHDALKPSNMYDGMYSSHEVKTLQQALRYVLDVFGLQYDPVKYDISTWAFTEKPTAVKESTLYTLDKDVDPIYRGITSYRAFRRKFKIKNKYWYGPRSIYTDALNRVNTQTIVAEEPEFLTQIRSNYATRKHEYEVYLSQIESAEIERIQQQQAIRREIKEKYEGDKIAYEYHCWKENEEQVKSLRKERACRPTWVRVMESVLSYISDEYGPLETYVPNIRANLSMLKIPVIQYPSTQYALAAVIVSTLLPDEPEKHIKKYFKTLCHLEGNDTHGFGTTYDLYKKLNADVLEQFKEAVSAPPKEESGIEMVAESSSEAYVSTSSVKNHESIKVFETQVKKAYPLIQKDIPEEVKLQKNYGDDFALSIHRALNHLFDVKKLSTADSEGKLLINVIIEPSKSESPSKL